MPTNFSKGISAYGAPILPNTGAGEVIMGDVYFVNSGNVDGADDIGTKGKTKTSPFVTASYAKSQATANNGDVIYLLPGHSENINSTSALAFDKAGVTYIGIGTGQLQPVFNLSTSGANKSRIGITGNGSRFYNIRFKANSTSIGSSSVGLYINANDVSIENCRFDHNSTLAYFANTIEIANNVKRANIVNNDFFNDGVASQSARAIDMRSTANSQNWCRIVGNEFYGNWSKAVIKGSSNASFRNCIIANNWITNNSTGGACIEVNSSKVTARAGNVSWNHIAYSATGVTSTKGIVTRNGWTMSRNYVNRSSSAGNAVGGISS